MTLKDKYNVEFGTQNTSLVKRWNRAIQKEIENLDASDIGMFIRQGHFYDTILPIALAMIERDPFAGELFPGQLLSNIADGAESITEYRESILATINRVEPLIIASAHEDRDDILGWIKIICDRVA